MSTTAATLSALSAAALLLPALARPRLPQPSRPRAPEELATLRLLGRVDGSVRIEFDRDGARFETATGTARVEELLVGSTLWIPALEPFLPNEDPRAFLERDVDFAGAQLVQLRGRDAAAIRCRPDGLTLEVSDTPPGSDVYELELRFPRVDPRYELELSARIDGSDELHITAEGARWQHRYWNWPEGPVLLDGQAWNPREHELLENQGATAFLPADADLASAELVSSRGRDLVGVEARAGEVVVRFADDPPGADRYEVRLRFRPARKAW